MATQKYFRCSAAIVEQPNGLYAMHMHTRFEHDSGAEPEKYQNLTWPEACDVLFSMMDTWGTERLRHLQSVLGDPWVQLSFSDLEPGATSAP